MEQHKVLLIIVSVCLFFAAVLGVGLWLFYPRTAGGPPVASVSGNGTTTKESRSAFDPIEYLRQGEQTPKMQQSQPNKNTGDVIIVYGNGQSSGTSATPGGSGALPGSSAEAPAEKPLVALPTGPSKPQPEKAPVRQATPAATSVAPKVPAGTFPAGKTPVGKTPARKAPVEKSTVKVAVVRSAARKTEQEYWIQLLASTRRDTVQTAQSRLQQQYSLNGRITTVTIGDKDYFRLRVGPYTSKLEAEKFRTWIREINGYAGAFISEVYTH